MGEKWLDNEAVKETMAVCFGRCILVLIQPKVGGAILILVIGSVLIFSASIHAKFSVIAAGIVVASAALLSKIIIFLGDHRYLPHFLRMCMTA